MKSFLKRYTQTVTEYQKAVFKKLHYSSSRVLFKPIWELNLNSWKKEIFQNEPSRIEPKRNENN
jgi:hypothetical protein